MTAAKLKISSDRDHSDMAGKSSESVQCAITGPCLRMHRRPSA